MTGVQIRLDYTLEPLDQALQRLVDFGQNTFAMMDEIGGEMVSSTQSRFETQTAHDGTPWEQSESARQRGGLTLVDQSLLVQSMTHNVFNDAAEIGTNSDYAAIHQFGGKAGRNHSVTFPARPFLGFSDQDESTILDIMQDHVVAAAGDLA